MKPAWAIPSLAAAIVFLWQTTAATFTDPACDPINDTDGMEWEVSQVGFAGEASCLLELQHGGLRITTLALIDWATTDEARMNLESRRSVSSIAIDLGDGAFGYDAPGTGQTNEITFITGRRMLVVTDTESFAETRRLAGMLDRRLAPSGSSESDRSIPAIAAVILVTPVLVAAGAMQHQPPRLIEGAGSPRLWARRSRINAPLAVASAALAAAGIYVLAAPIVSIASLGYSATQVLGAVSTAAGMAGLSASGLARGIIPRSWLPSRGAQTVRTTSVTASAAHGQPGPTQTAPGQPAQAQNPITPDSEKWWV